MFGAIRGGALRRAEGIVALRRAEDIVALRRAEDVVALRRAEDVVALRRAEDTAAPKSVRSSRLILSRHSLRMVDNEDLHWSLAHLQFEPELLLHSRKQRRPGVIR